MAELLYKLNKTDEDINTLLERHKNLIYYMLTRMNQLGNQDAESMAWEALWDAIGTFDVFSNVAFSTYACTLIRNAINNVLRKQQLDSANLRALNYQLELEARTYSMDTESSELVDYIEHCFQQFILTKIGVSKNVLLAWHSSGFLSTVTNLATMCSCSPSYVSRVQQDFRAYLSGRLKEYRQRG